MNSDTKTDPGVAVLVEQKRKYREHMRDMSLDERLRQLEALQEQTYELLRVRETNGGIPVPKGWQRWARAQESTKK
jgi:hypothetical protein